MKARLMDCDGLPLGLVELEEGKGIPDVIGLNWPKEQVEWPRESPAFFVFRKKVDGVAVYHRCLVRHFQIPLLPDELETNDA